MTLRQFDGGKLVGPLVEVRPEAGVASVVGPGEAILPITDGEAAATSLAWATQCDFLFDSGTEGDGSLRQVDARGKVVVADDALDLTSDALIVTLDDAGELASVLATGAVDADLRGDEATRLQTDRLWLEQKGDMLYLTAEGSVVADRTDGTVRGNTATAVLKDNGEQTTLGSLRIDGNVALADAEGRILRGDRATVGGEGEPVIITSQDPAGVTLVMSLADDQPAVTMSAATMVLDQADESLVVPGAGLLVQPVGEWVERRVTWTRALDRNAAAPGRRGRRHHGGAVLRRVGRGRCSDVGLGGFGVAGRRGGA